MLFRNSIRLIMENFKNVYKILLYQLIVSLVAGALCCAMVLPELIDIVNSAPAQEVLTQIKSFISAFFTLEHNALAAAKDALIGTEGALRRLAELVLSKATAIALAATGCVLVYLLKRFADTLCYFCAGSMLGDKMSAYAETPFWTAYAGNLGKASRYALAYVPVAFLFDIMTGALVWLLLVTLNILPGLFFAVTVLVLMQAIKLTFTGLWMPSMTVDNKPLKKSLAYQDKIEKRQIPKIYSTYVVSVYTVIIINVIAAVCTFGSALILTVPASYMLFICQQYVHYYTIKGKRYFITYDRIASNPDRGDREHFFDYVDETALGVTGVVATERQEDKTDTK